MREPTRFVDFVEHRRVSTDTSYNFIGSANAKSKLKIVEFSIDTSGKVSSYG